MNINSSLMNELRNKEYRNGYVASQIRIGIPFQIRALRNQRGLNQEEFASLVGMSQPRVSELERPGERRPNIETLLRIAEAYDIGLQVRFVPFSELVEWAESFNPDDFSVPSFEEEISKREKTKQGTTDQIAHVPPAAFVMGAVSSMASGGISSALQEKILGRNILQSENQKQERLKKLLTTDNRSGIVLDMAEHLRKKPSYESGEMPYAALGNLSR